MRTNRTWVLALLSLAGIGLLAACGDDDDDDVLPMNDLGVDLGRDGGNLPDLGRVDMGPIDLGPPVQDLGPVDMGGVDGGPPPRTCVVPTASTPRTVVPASITADVTWTCDVVYELTDFTWVEGATVTIEPGTTIVGRAGTRGALLVSRTGRLEAAGTAERPIVFTSSNALSGASAPAVSGDWGGIALLGTAENNLVRVDTSTTPPTVTTERIRGSLEGINPAEFGDKALYGSTSAATASATHDCGTITFARIEYAGYEYATGNELNGLTLGACGSDTTLSHIQVSFGKDDGIEFFGGTAGIDHAIVIAPGDDFLDYDEGYSGKVQFFIAQGRNYAGEERGIEADNLDENNDATPRTNATIFNATFIGSGMSNSTGPYFRRGSGTTLRNFISQGHARECVRVDGVATEAQLTGTPAGLILSNGLVGDCGPSPVVALRSQTAAGVTVLEAGIVVAGAAGTGIDLAAARNFTAPNFSPAAGSAATVGAATPPAGFEAAAYLGAAPPGEAAASAWYRASWTSWRDL